MQKSLLKLLRPKQWAKNLLVFAAWGFAGKTHEPSDTVRALLAFAAMCLLSSGIYCFNDAVDAERDRLHPTKKDRPVASGAVSKLAAYGIGLVLTSGAFAIALAFLNTSSLVLLGIYLALQVLYNTVAKSVPVFDVFTIASGFVLRAVLGASALALTISGWLLFCTGALALMLGFAKRRHEFVLQSQNTFESRNSLSGYSLKSLDALVTMFACGAAMCYGVYTLQSTTARAHPGVMFTAPFVFYAITRYVLRVLREDEGGEPADLLFGDPHILVSILLFVATAVWSLQGTRLPFLEP